MCNSIICYRYNNVIHNILYNLFYLHIQTTIFIKDKTSITVNTSHILNTRYISLKDEKVIINNFKNTINNYEINNTTFNNLKINYNNYHFIKITKDSNETLKKLNSNSKKDVSFDLIIILHKIELRTLLLGKNGIYNSIVKSQFNNMSNYLFNNKYILLFRRKDMLCFNLF